MTESNSDQLTERLKVDALWLLMIASAVCYGALTTLSDRFGRSVPLNERPTLVMLGLFFLAFLFYWAGLFLVVRLPASRKLLFGIFGSACLFRILMMPSIPMHEIDIYRYIWDGAVLAEGVSPYRYPPQEVLQAASQRYAPAEDELGRLVALCGRSESIADSLGHIHYGVYPSPYPLVSQAVFASAAWITPEDSSPHARLVIMKGLMVLLDLATLWVVMALVQEAGKHPGWSLAYGWCPLVMKEIANSGHLDSIAIFFTTLAIWLLIKTMRNTDGLQLRHVAGTGVMLALAIGAKLYPVVLMPLFTALWWRRGGKGACGVGVLSVAAISLALLYPLFGVSKEANVPAKLQVAAHLAVAGQPLASLPETEPMTREAVDPSAGIRTFLKHWEMNDLIFMIVLENLRSQAEVEPHRKPWFVLTSDAWTRTRHSLMKHWGTWAAWASAKIHPDEPQLSPEELLTHQNLQVASFLLARIVTGGLFALLACWLAMRAAAQDDPQQWGRAGMLTLAWFWLTCPTQNPWYWCWVLPLLPFARYRTWYVVGAMTLLYYLRFWLSAHFAEPPVVIRWFDQRVVLSKTYDGDFFFYFVMAWIEFAPCLVALGMEWLLDRKRPKIKRQAP